MKVNSPSLMSSLKYIPKRAIGAVANWKPVIAANTNKITMPAKYAADLAVASVCIKDTVGSYYYVTQSLNNKKIPKEKRGFVAALDLANGVFNVTTQILLSKLLLTEKVLDKIYKGAFKSKEATGNLIKHFSKGKKAPKWLVSGAKSYTGTARVGFGTVVSLVVTSVLAKRVIVPLFATPTAGYIEKRFMKDDSNKAGTIEHLTDLSICQKCKTQKNPFDVLKELQKENMQSNKKTIFG